ncbi:NLI interacting factor [Tribonema minus]|uniref:Mitochondrial import inner membrane translocase subunit TIM50 n=1 Tax=Tribonema minus TaxID=303371 RepID=A0A835ZEQ8_9STRA|nr:NLI interacting factor [Tribonema minus]
MQVIVFTASLPQYANPLLDLLDPKGHITGRLFRHHCTFQEGYFIKDLTRLRNNQNLMNTIIVDNSPIAYKFQPENAIDCTTWLGVRPSQHLL